MKFSDEQRAALTTVLERVERGIAMLEHEQIELYISTTPVSDTDPVTVLCLRDIRGNPTPYGYVRPIVKATHPDLAALRAGVARLRTLLIQCD